MNHEYRDFTIQMLSGFATFELFSLSFPALIYTQQFSRLKP